MKKNFKRTVASLLAVVMILCATPLSGFVGLELPSFSELFGVKAEAATTSGTCGENLTWNFDENTGTLTISGTGEMNSYSASQRPWNTYVSQIKKVVIGFGATNIGKRAFYACSNLTNVQFSESVTSIGEFAFYSCSSIKSIDMPNSIKEIGGSAFSDCYNLTNISIPNSVTKIGSMAFCYCPFTSIVIPRTVTSIGNQAFLCKKLEKITVESNNEYFSNDEYGVLFNKDKTNLIQYPIGNSRTSYKIPDGVKSIGDSAFLECNNLENITIPDSVTSILSKSFLLVTNLKAITVDDKNQYYSNDEYGVLFNKNKTNLVQYPIGNPRTDYTIPKSVTKIGFYSFRGSKNIVNITIYNNLEEIDQTAFYNCPNLTNVYYQGTNEEWESISILAYNDALTNATIHFTEDNISYTINFYDGDTLLGSKTLKADEESTLSYGQVPTKKGYKFDGWSDGWSGMLFIDGSALSNKGSSLFIDGIGILTSDRTVNLYAVWTEIEKDIYNLGEETYSFANFGDSDSAGGHCFGMSMTSAGYYLNYLDITDVGGNKTDDVYGLKKTNAVQKPICYYQSIQGYSSSYATVAGGCYYLKGYYDIASDWNSVVNYVKNHEYDNKGSLQIGFRKNYQGGHAINFLRYEEVNGQQRIYAYDNNFPNVETYFYMASDGKVYQAPNSTFSGAIDCIALRSVDKYYSVVGSFDSTRYIYADRDTVNVIGATVYALDGGVEMGERVVFEVPAGVEQVTITPLTDNAEFTYLDDAYSFGNVEDDTVGMLSLVSSDDFGVQEPTFTVTKKEIVNVSIVSTPSNVNLTYKKGAALDGLKVIAKYSDGSEVDVTDKVNVTGFDTNSTGDKTATVEFEGQTATFNYSVSYAWWQWIIIIVLFGWIWY